MRCVPVLLCAVICGSRELPAQCPDGSRPPCGQPRRDAPRLSDRTWLVLPFVNTARAGETALIGDASVNLLYQDLSRWSEISMISDDRVADLVRRGGAREGRIGLAAALDMARRVGAGRLVLGEYLAIGGRARIAATLYDVRSGRQIRAIREQLDGYASRHALDSLTAAFGRVAQALLDVRTAPRPRQGLGTSSLEAFRLFQAGMASYQAGRLDSARDRFAAALALDSNYAWAHFRLYWVSASLGLPFAGYREHLDAAARLAANLPPRERALIGGWIALPRGQVDEVCARAAELLQADSADAEAWHFRGHCLSGDTRVVPHPGDTTRFAFRTDVSAAIDAFEHATILDPSHLESFSDLIGWLRTRVRGGCAVSANPCPEDHRFVGLLRGTRDSVVVVARRPSEVGGRFDAEGLAAWRDRLDRAQSAAAQFVAANPESWQGRAVHASLLLQVGNLPAASRELETASHAMRLPTQRRLVYRDRLELFLRRGWADSAASLVDSIRSDSASRAGLTFYHSTMGRFTEDTPPSADSVRRARAEWLPIVAGVLPEHFDRIEEQYAASFPAEARRAFLELSTLVAFRMRQAGPALDTAAHQPLRRAQAFLAGGDTTRARALLQDSDAELASRGSFTIDDGSWLFVAEGLLAVGDTARALARLSDWARRWPTMPLGLGTILDQTTVNATARLLGRTWLLFGDLAAAAGRTADARQAYRMVTGLWERGEAPVQPLAARARAALTRLGP